MNQFTIVLVHFALVIFVFCNFLTVIIYAICSAGLYICGNFMLAYGFYRATLC